MDQKDEKFECIACKACLVDMSGKRKVSHAHLEVHNALVIVTATHTILTQYGIEHAPFFFVNPYPRFLFGPGRTHNFTQMHKQVWPFCVSCYKRRRHLDIKPSGIEGAGMGVWATQDIEVGETICR